MITKLDRILLLETEILQEKIDATENISQFLGVCGINSRYKRDLLQHLHLKGLSTASWSNNKKQKFSLRKLNSAKNFEKEIAPKLFVKNSVYSGDRARRLIRKWNGYFQWLEQKCELCKNTGKWLNQNLVLQLDHKNGDNRDHRLENLRFLCPNCHSQTESYCGRNKKSKVA